MKTAIQKLLLVVTVAVLLLAPCALADSNTELYMTGAGNNIMDHLYVGPYDATVGNAENQRIICTDFADESDIGQKWAVTVNTFSSLGSTLWGSYLMSRAGGGLTLSQVTVLYKEAAWLTLQMLSGKNTATQVGYISYAIWYLFDPNGTTSNHTGVYQYLNPTHNASCAEILPNLQQWIIKAQNNYKSLTPSQLDAFKIYSPLGCTVPGNCPAQEFFSVPEGSSSATYLLLTGMLSLAAILFRRWGPISGPRR
jgi:hypothetical protein